MLCAPDDPLPPIHSSYLVRFRQAFVEKCRKSFGMRTYEICICKSFRMRSYKNKGLKVY